MGAAPSAPTSEPSLLPELPDLGEMALAWLGLTSCKVVGCERDACGSAIEIRLTPRADRIDILAEDDTATSSLSSTGSALAAPVLSSASSRSSPWQMLHQSRH